MGTTLRRCSKSVAGVGSPAPLIGCRTPTVKCTTPPSCTYLGRLPSQLLKVVASDRCASHAVCVCYLIEMAWDSIEQPGIAPERGAISDSPNGQPSSVPSGDRSSPASEPASATCV